MVCRRNRISARACWLSVGGQLERVLRAYRAHYDGAPYRAVELHPPGPAATTYSRIPAQSNAMTCSADASANTTERQRERRFARPQVGAGSLPRPHGEEAPDERRGYGRGGVSRRRT